MKWIFLFTLAFMKGPTVLGQDRSYVQSVDKVQGNSASVSNYHGVSFTQASSKKAAQTLTIQFKTPGLYHYQIVDDGTVIDRNDRVDSNDFQTAIQLEQGNYRVQGYAEISTGDGPDQVYFFGRDELEMASDTSLVFDAANGLSPTLFVTDLDGIRRDFSEINHKYFNVMLTHLNSPGWETRSFSTQVSGDGPLPLVDGSLNENFYFEVVGLALLNEKAPFQFSEFGFRFEGGTESLVFENDWRNHKPITWEHKRVSSPSTQIEVSYVAESPLSGDAVFDGSVLSPGAQLEAPFEITILAMPQDVPFPGTWEHRQFLRRFNVVEHDEVTTRTLNSGRFKVLDKNLMAFMELHVADTEELYVSSASKVSMGDSMVFPGFQFFSSYITYFLNLYTSFGTGFFLDSWQNGVSFPDLAFTLLDLDTNEAILEGGPELLDTDGNPFSYTSNRFSFVMNFESRFQGQSVNGNYIAGMEFSDGDDTPPWIESMYVEQDGERSSVLMGPARFVMDLKDFRTVANATLELETGLGWTSVPLDRDGNSFSADLPNHQPGTYGSMKIKAQDQGGHNFEIVLDRALRWGGFYVVPWMVNNSQWSTRVAVANSSDQSEVVWLEALTADGVTQTKQVEIPGNGVYSAEAGELFPNLSGYRLKINCLSNALYPSFLTFNLEEASGGRSPSQTTAQFSGDLTSRLLFPYLPGDQLPAIVICAPDRGGSSGSYSASTPVDLTLADSTGGVIARKTITLIGGQPQALLVNGLFEDVNLPANATIEAVAHNGTHLSGTTFTFNHQREPSMASGLNRPHESANGQVIPWVVSNGQWNSRIAVYNRDQQSRLVNFTATTREGQILTISHPIPAQGVLAWEAQELFPNLSGYSLVLDVDESSKVFASFLTFNTEVQSGGASPSQTTSVLPAEFSSDLIFSYLPTKEISALVLTAPKREGQTRITLTVFGSDKGILGEKEIELTDGRPFAALIGDLFKDLQLPDHVAVRAVSRDDVVLTGTAFIFNERREPSMAKPVKVR